MVRATVAVVGVGIALAVGMTAGGRADAATATARADPQAPIVEVKTFNLEPIFKSPWQLQWVNGGSASGTMVFSDRGGNAVGFLNPLTGATSRIALTSLTSPNGIAPVDPTTFAVAADGGAAFFDSSGAGTFTQLQMASRQRQLVNVSVEGDSVFFTDTRNDEVIALPAEGYENPATHTVFGHFPGCGPTGFVPHDPLSALLCQRSDTLLFLNSSGAQVRRIALPSGSRPQEARRAPSRIVFSMFGTDRIGSATYGGVLGPSWPIAQSFSKPAGPAVPVTGFAWDPLSDGKTVIRGGYGIYYDTVVPHYAAGGATLVSFPSGTVRHLRILQGRNLVGSAIGPGCSFWLADATAGKPALHRLTFGVPDWPAAAKAFGATEFRYPAQCTDFTSGTKSHTLKITLPAAWKREKTLEIGGVYYPGDPWGGFRPNQTSWTTSAGKGSFAETGPFSSIFRVTNIPAKAKTVTVTITGPATPNAPFGVQTVARATTAPETCECTSIRTGARFDSMGLDANGVRMTIEVYGVMSCTGGAGRCSGEVSVSLTRAERSDGLRLTQQGEPTTTLACEGSCESGEAGRSKNFFNVTGGANFGAGKLGTSVKTITLEIERRCGGKETSQALDFAFTPEGRYDWARSDRNGNGIPDGEEKKRKPPG